MCIFCKIISKEIPSEIVYEDEDVLAFLDVAKITLGHTLVIPKTHYENINDCPPEVLQHIIKIVQKLSIDYQDIYHYQGVNILNNSGEVAGQSVHHLHFHLIPRYDAEEIILIEKRK